MNKRSLVQSASSYADAAAEFLQYAASLDAGELRARTALIRKFDLSGNGHHQPPPELSLGLSLDGASIGSGLVAVTSPSKIAGYDVPHVSGVFHQPRNFLGLLVGDEDTGTAGITRRASFLLRSVPISLDVFRSNLRRLRDQVPEGVRQRMLSDFFGPLASMVAPNSDPLIRRELVVSLPLAAVLNALRKGNSAALLGEDPVSPGELAALVGASLDGRASGRSLRGQASTILQRVAPFDPSYDHESYTGSGQRFVFFCLEPTMGIASIRYLLKLDVDLLLHVELIGDQMKAELLARGRDDPDNPGRRTQYLQQQLILCCDVVRPIKGEKNILVANSRFQPGASSKFLSDGFPVEDAPLLVNGLTSTICNPQIDGDIYVGKERGGTPFLFTLGNGATGGRQHFAFIGQGSSGKTTLMNLITPQVGKAVRVCFTPNGREAFSELCWRWGLNHEEAKSEGAVRLVSTGEGGGSREWVVNFQTSGRQDLRMAFTDDVIQAAREFVENLDLYVDPPISIRPDISCNLPLYAAWVSLIMSGKDPWGQDHFEGLWPRIAKQGAGGSHWFVQFDDPYVLPSYNSKDPTDLAGLFGDSVRELIGKMLGSAHKDNIHVAAGLQSEEDAQKIPGGLNRFHLVFQVRSEEVLGRTVHHVRVYDPTNPDEPLANLNAEIGHPDLLRLLSRRRVRRG